ncbi:MAG TPA: paraquat-inducible protein A [Burkholderiales bacterium]|nr:paraquat-inducible protein A [Burkholderiales bacterium]
MAARQETLCCPVCSLLQQVEPIGPRSVAECPRCGAVLREWKAASVAPTAALALAALILYLPANLYPILRMERYGLYTETTVWGGVVQLANAGYWFVAAIVFLASMVVPLVKLLGLFVLVSSAELRSSRWRRARTRLYRFIDVVGPWAMLDVFLVAVLIALVRLGAIASVIPGPGLAAFTAVVVLTMLASALFDPRFLWRSREWEASLRRQPEAGT